MAHISGTDLPREKCVEIGLTYIYGTSVTSSDRILSQAGVDPNMRVKDLTGDEAREIVEVIVETQVVEGDLGRQIAMDIKRLTETGYYRGIRHRKGLPVRGQRTKTNVRTYKSSKKAVTNKKK